MKEKLWFSSCIGVITSFILSMFWKNLFISTGAIYLGAIAPVNLSIWENLKILVFPFAVFAIFEYLSIKPYKNQYFSSKIISLGIIIAFYTISSYISLLFNKGNSIIWNIIFIALSFSVGFITFYLLYTKKGDLTKWLTPLAIAFGVLVILMIYFTFKPPMWHLFRDPNIGDYGILSYYTQKSLPLSEMV